MGNSKGQACYKVVVEAGDEDIMRRIALLNSAVFRVLKVARLRQVLSSDYQRGCIELMVEARQLDTMIVPGSVSVSIEDATANGSSC
jgi:hypothetical protein